MKTMTLHCDNCKKEIEDKSQYSKITIKDFTHSKPISNVTHNYLNYCTADGVKWIKDTEFDYCKECISNLLIMLRV